MGPISVSQTSTRGTLISTRVSTPVHGLSSLTLRARGGLAWPGWSRRAGAINRAMMGGCFAAALAAVRTYGGVLEHPAYSAAWPQYSLARPHRDGGWQRSTDGGWVCQVEQGRYGHPAKKATWLYAFGLEDPPVLRWGYTHDAEGKALVSWCGNHTAVHDHRPRLSSKLASRSPVEFRNELLSIARLARRPNSKPH